MNDEVKTPGQSFTPTSGGKSRRKRLEVLEHCARKSRSANDVAALIGVRKIVTAWSSRYTNPKAARCETAARHRHH